jgi:YD repeat-containing protein
VLRSTFVRYGLRAGFAVLACCLRMRNSHHYFDLAKSCRNWSVCDYRGNEFRSLGIGYVQLGGSIHHKLDSDRHYRNCSGRATNGNVVVTSGGHSSSGFPFTLNNGPVSYVYDDLGRLAAVIDVYGNAAEYSYDAVGNILSISRFTATQVSVINFSPESGPVGTAVTINGTGFSVTPSQNTVKFNGTTATVSSSTANQLQVSVPASATTGPISVTSPNGNATSTSNFTVSSSSGAPTITSFSPASGVAGTVVNLTGTNFDPTLANDDLRLNASQSVVSAATSTTMTTTVPAATASGRFNLFTPAGNAVSSQDFYIPFLSHLPGDIGLTVRIAQGGSQPVTLSASKIALVLFDGVAGQRISIGVNPKNFPSCNLYLFAPNNSQVALTSCTTNTGLPSTYLPQTGTYTIGIDPGTSSGSLTLALTADILGSIQIGGSTVTVTTTASGQDARLSFTATLGQQIQVTITNVTNPLATVNLLTPDGTIQSSLYINNNPAGQTSSTGPLHLTPRTSPSPQTADPAGLPHTMSSHSIRVLLATKASRPLSPK